MVTVELQHEIEQFLYGEARLLSEGRYREWLAQFTDDVKYWLPVRETKTDRDDGVANEDELAIFDDDKSFLSARVERFYSHLAHAERPPSRTRYFVTNVEIESLSGSDLQVRCNLLVYQARLEKTECFFVGRREDLLRRVDDRWRIARRKIVLDQTLLPRTISILF
jgi:3-phenylpropionate/cinnamic acid dioxygenase small subunit